MNSKKTSSRHLASIEFDLARFTPYRVALAASLISEALARQYRQRFEISIPDWRVLAHLVHSEGASVRDIENQVAMEKSKVSRAVARLVSRGLVVKRQNRDDKRLVHVSLTKKGQGLMMELLPLANDFQSRTEAILGRDLKAFEKGLQQLIEAIDRQIL